MGSGAAAIECTEVSLGDACREVRKRAKMRKARKMRHPTADSTGTAVAQPLLQISRASPHHISQASWTFPSSRVHLGASIPLNQAAMEASASKAPFPLTAADSDTAHLSPSTDTSAIPAQEVHQPNPERKNTLHECTCQHPSARSNAPDAAARLATKIRTSGRSELFDGPGPG